MTFLFYTINGIIQLFNLTEACKLLIGCNVIRVGVIYENCLKKNPQNHFMFHFYLMCVVEKYTQIK